MLQLDQQMKQLQNDHDVAKSTHGHRSEKAQGLVAEFKATREKHRKVGKQVAAALSPVEEIDTGLKLETAVTGRAGLTLVLPALDQQELGRLVGHFPAGFGLGSSSEPDGGWAWGFGVRGSTVDLMECC
ncbi:MAG: hypothetical protein MH186_06685 [Marinobacter sp.]|nr:hypothetical protein [Marinobacter sp.]